MNNQQHSLTRFLALCCLLLLLRSPAVSQSFERDVGTKSFTEKIDHRDLFIAALEWSVDKQTDYVWPFESIKPAPFKSVRMLVEQMPRAWPDRGGARDSSSLSAHGSLKVNGNRLPRPQRNGSREEFRVYLEKGRLRLAFSVPAG